MKLLIDWWTIINLIHLEWFSRRRCARQHNYNGYKSRDSSAVWLLEGRVHYHSRTWTALLNTIPPAYYNQRWTSHKSTERWSSVQPSSNCLAPVNLRPDPSIPRVILNINISLFITVIKHSYKQLLFKLSWFMALCNLLLYKNHYKNSLL